MTHLECVSACMVTFFSQRARRWSDPDANPLPQATQTRKRKKARLKGGHWDACDDWERYSHGFLPGFFALQGRQSALDSESPQSGGTARPTAQNRQCLSGIMLRRSHLCSRSWKVAENINVEQNMDQGYYSTTFCFADDLHMDFMMILLPPFPLFPHILFLILLPHWNCLCFPW